MEANSVDGSEETPAAAVQRELARVGEHTAGLLSSAGETASKLVADARGDAERITAEANATADAVRAEAQAKADATRAEADGYSEKVRAEADEFAQTVRGNAYSFAQERRRKAEIDAEGHVADARDEAEHIITVAHDRRAGLQTVIADLSERRESLLTQLELIADNIWTATSRHREGVEEFDPVPAEDEEYRPPSGAVWDEDADDAELFDRLNPLDTLGNEIEAEAHADLPDGAVTGGSDHADAGDDPHEDGDADRRSSPWLPPRALDADVIPSESSSPPG